MPLSVDLVPGEVYCIRMIPMNTISTICFDLDGTLLPLDEKMFSREYFERFTTRCIREGLAPEKALPALIEGIGAMQRNCGEMSNRDAFWKEFFSRLDLPFDDGLIDSFTSFYTEEFSDIGHHIPDSPVSREIVTVLREKGYALILATTPLFPRVGTLERMRWIGLKEDDFELITTYEDFSYTKPHTGYYKEVLWKSGCRAEEILMVGNNISDDGAVAALGVPCLFVTDNLINPEGDDLSLYRCMTLRELHAFCLSLPRCAIGKGE